MTRDEWIERLKTLGVAGLNSEEQQALIEQFDLQNQLAEERALDALLDEGLAVPASVSESSSAAVTNILSAIADFDREFGDESQFAEALDQPGTELTELELLANSGPYAQFQAAESQSLESLLDFDDLPPAIANYDNAAARNAILANLPVDPVAQTPAPQNTKPAKSPTPKPRPRVEQNASSSWLVVSGLVVLVLGGVIFSQFAGQGEDKPQKPSITVVKQSDQNNNPNQINQVKITKDPVTKTHTDSSTTPLDNKTPKPLQPPENWLPKDQDKNQDFDPTQLAKGTQPKPLTPENDSQKDLPEKVETPTATVTETEQLLASLDPVDREIILNQELVENLDDVQNYEIVMSAELLSLVDEDDLE